ncbi:glutathione hydrolase 1 proenzyme-like [Amblyomma americanum]
MSAPEGEEGKEGGSPRAATGTEGAPPSGTGGETKPPSGLSSITVALGLCACCCCAVIAVVAISFVLAIWDVYTELKQQLMPEEFEYGQWATVSDVSECSHVVREAFQKGGKLADAAVSTLLCMGVAAPHLMGIGGGFIALHYDQKTDKVKALNALGKSASSVGVLAPKETKRGSQASIVPGALQGYEILHKDLGGKFSWEQLFAPAINLANNGFPIKKHFADILKSHESEIASSAELQKIFKDVKKEGDKLVQADLGKTLTDISKEGASAFYTTKAGELITKLGATTLTAQDFSGYKASWVEPITQNTVEDEEFFTAPFPSSGVLITAGVERASIGFTSRHQTSTFSAKDNRGMLPYLKKRMQHVLVAIPELDGREADLGFPGLIKQINDGIKSKKDAAVPKHTVVQDYGGVHLSIVNEEGALSIVSGLNEPFGSKVVPLGGVIMNNYVSAFAPKHASDAKTPNELAPSSQPRTSLIPIMAKRRSEKMIRLVAGSGGGLKGMWALVEVLTCIKLARAPSCVQEKDRIAPEISGGDDSVKDIQPTANGIFAKKPYVSWVAPSDNVHCDGSSGGGKVTVDEKMEAYDKIKDQP